MHPIERLRYVARAGGVDQQSLVREAAGSLASLDVDPAGLVTACRRIIQRHPGAGTLWTLCARVLTDVNGLDAAWDVVGQVVDDRSGVTAVDELPDGASVLVVGWTDLVPSGLPRRGDLSVLVVDVDGDGEALADRLVDVDVDATAVPVAGLGAAAAQADVVLLDAELAGATAAIAVAGSRAAAAVCRAAGGSVRLVVGAARVLPERAWDVAVPRVVGDRSWDAPLEVVPFDLVDMVVRPWGPFVPTTATFEPDAPLAPELLISLTW